MDPFSFIAPALNFFASAMGNSTNKIDLNKLNLQSQINMKYAKELAQYQYDLQKQQFDYTNEYNTPANQVNRLVDAQLNPNLAYGSGSVVGSTASMPSVSQPHMNMPDPGALMQYQLQSKQLALQSAQVFANIAKTYAETKAINLDNQKKGVESVFWKDNAEVDNFIRHTVIDMNSISIDKGRYDANVSRLKNDILDFIQGKTKYDPRQPVNSEWNKEAMRLEALANSPLGESILFELSKGSYDMDVMNKNIEILKGEIERLPYLSKKLKGEALVAEFEGNLAAKGISPKDPLWMRVIAFALCDVFGLSLPGLLEKAVQSGAEFLGGLPSLQTGTLLP